MKPIREILTDSLEVLKYISESTPHYKKKKKKLEKMIKEYDENPDAFFEKYLEREDL